MYLETVNIQQRINMYYEEKIIDGQVMCRTMPDGEWRPISKDRLMTLLTKVMGGVK